MIVVVKMMCLAFFHVVAIITNLSTFTVAKILYFPHLAKSFFKMYFFSIFALWFGFIGLCVYRVSLC